MLQKNKNKKKKMKEQKKSDLNILELGMELGFILTATQANEPSQRLQKRNPYRQKQINICDVAAVSLQD